MSDAPPAMDGQNQAQEYKGVLPPMSLECPTEQCIAMSSKLEAALRARGSFESEEDAKTRVEVLDELREMMIDWSLMAASKKDVQDPVGADNCAAVYPFGSYRLGVHESGADIDTLVVVPRHVDKVDFFGDLVRMLEEHKEVEDIAQVRAARVPVIKFEIRKIPIDLAMARLPVPIIPEEFDIDDDSILEMCDEQTVTALNGRRVTDEIIRLVPEQEQFRLALRAVKLWAKARGLYSNAMGFLGGVAWSILVAQVCQLWPNATAATLLKEFFSYYAEKDWQQPVELCHRIPGSGVWDPIYNPRHRLHCMPVITPTYPAQNATLNVSASTLAIIKQEIALGREVTQNILHGKQDWAALFSKSSFFRLYKNYLEIQVSATTEQEFRTWKGFIESQLRKLTLLLENTPSASVGIAHPRIDSFRCPPAYCRSGYEFACCFYMGLKFDLQGTGASVDLSIPVNDFCATVSSTGNVRTPRMDILILHTKRQKIPGWVLDRVAASEPDTTTLMRSESGDSVASMGLKRALSQQETEERRQRPRSET